MPEWVPSATSRMLVEMQDTSNDDATGLVKDMLIQYRLAGVLVDEHALMLALVVERH